MEPVIREKVYTDKHGTFRIRVKAGLHYLRANRQPYFTLTGDIDEQGRAGLWRDFTGGCIHDEILRHWPELAPLAALHLSGMDGIPLHAEANGWYWLAGALGGMGEAYHGGNGFPERTTDYCLDTFAKLCRIDLDTARGIALAVRSDPDPRGVWRAYCEALEPKWRGEAEAAINTYGLKVFGDAWRPA